jgi:hypothetical protein
MLERKKPVLVSSLPSLGLGIPVPWRQFECRRGFLSHPIVPLSSIDPDDIGTVRKTRTSWWELPSAGIGYQAFCTRQHQVGATVVGGLVRAAQNGLGRLCSARAPRAWAGGPPEIGAAPVSSLRCN